MNINRDNYEMYFLLYVDRELSAADCTAVEIFVAENADLKAELESLLSVILPVEEISFKAKADLYKNDVSPGVLKEQMLLHMDNELDASAVLSLGMAIASNDALKREWNILQQVKLDPNEKIIFENKQILYRHEKDNVVSMRSWRRVAVAAAIIGAGIFVGISVFTKDDHAANVAVTDRNGKAAPKNLQPVKTTIPGKENNNIISPVQDENLANTEHLTPNNNIKENRDEYHQPLNDEHLVSNSPDNKKNSPIKNKIVSVAEQKNEIVKKENNNLPKPYFENINEPNSNKTVSSNVKDNIQRSPEKNEPVSVEKDAMAKNDATDPKSTVEDTPLTETRNSYAKNTVLDESASETTNNHILFMDEEKINRSKISGLFRKVKRVLARNANIKSGNSVKIAGFEIAAK